jgi:hypothetical protein
LCRLDLSQSKPDQPVPFSLSEPFFFRIERAHLKWDQKNSLIESRSSGVKGVALGKVSLANRIKSME